MPIALCRLHNPSPSLKGYRKLYEGAKRSLESPQNGLESDRRSVDRLDQLVPAFMPVYQTCLSPSRPHT